MKKEKPKVAIIDRDISWIGIGSQLDIEDIEELGGIDTTYWQGPLYFLDTQKDNKNLDLILVHFMESDIEQLVDVKKFKEEFCRTFSYATIAIIEHSSMGDMYKRTILDKEYPVVSIAPGEANIRGFVRKFLEDYHRK
jgi:hypothetical protein